MAKRTNRVRDRLDWNWLDSPGTVSGLLMLMMVVGLLLTSCTPPIEGTVVGKDSSPGRTETYYGSERYACGTESYTASSGTGKNRRTYSKLRTKYCTRQVPRTRRIPPKWQLNVKPNQGNPQWVSVSRSAWDRVRLGDNVNTGQL